MRSRHAPVRPKHETTEGPRDAVIRSRPGLIILAITSRIFVVLWIGSLFAIGLLAQTGDAVAKLVRLSTRTKTFIQAQRTSVRSSIQG